MFYSVFVASAHEIFRIGFQRALSAKFAITSYICPNIWENPWCPERPGMSGYMFVGLGEEIHRFVQPEVHELFVGLVRTNYKLMGRYEAHRVEPLTVAEWQTLPEKVSESDFKRYHLLILVGSDSNQVLRNYTTQSERFTFRPGYKRSL